MPGHSAWCSESCPRRGDPSSLVVGTLSEDGAALLLRAPL
jgi:hypothetical protein